MLENKDKIMYTKLLKFNDAKKNDNEKKADIKNVVEASVGELETDQIKLSMVAKLGWLRAESFCLNIVEQLS